MPFNVLVSCGCFTISPFLTVLPSPLKKGDDLSIPLYFFTLQQNPYFLITNNAEKIRIRLGRII